MTAGKRLPPARIAAALADLVKLVEGAKILPLSEKKWFRKMFETVAARRKSWKPKGFATWGYIGAGIRGTAAAVESQAINIMGRGACSEVTQSGGDPNTHSDPVLGALL